MEANDFGVVLMSRFARAVAEAGWTPQDVEESAQNVGLLRSFREVRRGTHEIRSIDRVIDLSSPARLPFNGATVGVHRGEGIVKLERRGDDLYLDGKKINLFFSKKQKAGSIGGHDLRKELEKRGDNVSAKVLDHLVDHPELWPESWKKDAKGNTVYVFFWDDVFRDSRGSLVVRCGCWNEGQVVSDCYWLDYGWRGSGPAASLAS